MVTRFARRSKRRPITNVVLAAGFFVLIFAPLAGLVLDLDDTPLSTRQPTPFPELAATGTAIKALPGGLRAYFKDNFGFKGALIRAHGLLKVRGLGVSSTPKVLIGNDGFLFIAADYEGALADYRGLAPFTEGELAEWRAVLEQRHVWLADRGIRYLVVITPNKHSIYGELLPEPFGTPATDTRRLDQLLAAMADSPVRLLDLRPTLRDAKAGSRVYYKTDTHWNEIGAWYGYRAIIDALRTWYPALQPIPRDSLRVDVRAGEGGDLARLLGIKYDWTEQRHYVDIPNAAAQRVGEDGPEPLDFHVLDAGRIPLVRTRSARGQIGRVLVFRDSFFNQPLPYLAEHFGSADWVWQKPDTNTNQFDTERVEQFRPDLVIQQFTERRLVTLRLGPMKTDTSDQHKDHMPR